MNLELVSDDRDYQSEVSVKVSSISNIRNLVKTSLSFKFLPGVMEDMEVPYEASAKVSSRFNIRNPVKTPPVLQFSSWSFGGY